MTQSERFKLVGSIDTFLIATVANTYAYPTDEQGHMLTLPSGTAINRQRVNKLDEGIGEYYSDDSEGEYVLQRRTVQAVVA